MKGALGLGGQFALLPRGVLRVSRPRELTVAAPRPAAYGPGGALARDTLARDNPRALIRLQKDDRRGDLVSTPLLPPPGGALATLADQDVVAVYDEPVIWGGAIHRQYGHFLVESTARLWPLLPGGELEGFPAVLTMPWTLAFGRDWLEAFGVETVNLPEHGAVRFKSMVVPEPSWRVDSWIAPELRDVHLHARDGLDVPSPPQHKVVWLSRTNLRRERAPYDEALLELLLGDHITVIRPESTTLAEQVAVLEGSQAVAGVRGSAFHTLLLTRKTPECLYLCPPWDKGAYPAQHMIMGTEATFAVALTSPASVPALRRRVLAGDGVSFPGAHRISIPAALRALRDAVLPDLFEDSRIAAFAEPERHWSRRVGRTGPPDLDAAVAGVLLEPHSADARIELGEMLQDEGLDRCAREQLDFAAYLDG